MLEDGNDQVFGRYRLRYRLARGGMASVYLAQAQGPGGFEKWVALKTIHPHFSDDQRFVRMFLDEARLSARLSHPNICAVFDFGEVEGSHYLAMEYLKGEPLRGVINAAVKGAALPYQLVARMIADAARGLHSAHDVENDAGEPLGLVHRDVSPQNIFVLYDGVAKVVDFGIARARDRLAETSTGEVKGKMAYMAPEQLDTKEVDRRSDIFALGIVLWEASTLKRLFKRESTAQTVAAVLRDPVPPPTRLRGDYPPFLEQIVLRALDRDPDERFQTMAEFADALESFVLATGTPAGHAQVSAWMKVAFAARIAQRNAMLRAPSIPSGLVIDVDVSTNSSVVTSGSPGAVVLETAPRKRRRSVPWVILAVAVIAVATGVGGWLLGQRGQEAPNVREVAAAGSAPTSPVAANPVADPTPGPGVDVAAGAIPAEAGVGDGGAPPAAEPAEVVAPPAVEAPATTKTPSPTKRPPRPAATPPPAPGYINLMSVPVATVWLGGRRLGTTPIQKMRVPAGRHHLKLRAVRGKGSESRRVTIRPGKVTYLSVRLDP